MKTIIKYLTPILGVILVSLIGTIFTNLGMDFYLSLNKPSIYLPSFVIPLVWTIIYSLISIFLIYLTRYELYDFKLKLLLILNGIFNCLWCLVYFYFENILLGLIIIIINLLLAILLIKKVKEKSNVFYYMLLLYPTWIVIATCLNTALWIIN